MKKIIAIFLLFFIASDMVFADFATAESIKINEEKIVQTMLPCANLMNEATQNSSSLKYVKACECALKQDLSSLDETTEKDFKNLVYAIYIQNALDGHKITKKKKYLNKAYKVSKKALKNEIDNTEILKTIIMISSFKGSPRNVVKAYTQFCEVNKKECELYYSQYDEIYNQSKLAQKEKRKWIKNTFLVIFIAMAAFGGAYAGANSANNKKNITCNTIGNTTYCNEY